ncbi:uncharacterized protein LOC132756146 [Ruditapes philippinarum]|uniref:uncharacterized protein LOC132756146 n=1 Tax=Ruditapes philippinarum TaxID=129788 RepID=UPI00295A91DE|nr:uncharacterized protein LOC132756146 [Ruditapes philippinarum]
MKVYLVCGFVLSAVVAIVLSKCHPGDLSSCSGLTCSDPNQVVGCEHDVCTCVAAGGSGSGAANCTDKPDCVGQIHCKHDEDFHCIDKQCACLKVHHGHGP